MNANERSVRERIVQVTSEVFGLPPEVIERGISPEAVDGWDSEKHVVLLVALEDHFGCMFEVEEVPELISLERIEEIVIRHGAGGD
jgi:acyl carrier protein